MSLLHYLRLPFASGDDWQLLQKARRSARSTFLLLTLPLSLLPPAMLLYAGANHAEAFRMAGGPERWQMLAALFLVVELLTVPLMAWLIKEIAAQRQIAVTFNDAILLAAVTAVPLWLSSLGLAIPHLSLAVPVLLLGLFLAGTTLYHGTFSFLKMSEPIDAQSLATEVFAAGALVWVLVCVFIVLNVTGT